MWKQIRQKLHNANLGRLCRRGVALAMAVSMILPSSAYGFDIMVGPMEMVDGEAPTIIVEANAVINRWYDPALGDPTDYLTGELEVAIRVKSGTRDGELQAFNTVALALKYNADILTPCRWTSKWDDTYGQDNDQREMTDLMPVASSEIYSPSSMTSMQTLKNNKISDATAHVCETVTTETDGGDGYVFIRMDSDRPLVLGDEKREGELFADEQGTVLGVISFSYNVEDYKILAAEAVKWLSAESASAGEGDTVTVPNGDRLIQLATHEELNGKYTDFGVEVSYDSEKNGMFYSSDPNASRFINQPPTFNRLTLNEETYTEKEIKEHQINFVLTNKTTYNDGGLSLDDLATVVFYDWDDTLIGVLIVPRDGDARKLVNDYVCNNMIHPDLRPGGTSTPNYSSMARIDNYRGKYPATAPMVEGGKDTTMDGNRPNDKYVGSNYPLTNKIDYVFLKRPMEKVTTDADGAPITTNTWRQKGEENAEWDTLYPYIYGWALIPDDNLTDIQYTHPENLWTTIGVGELKEYTGALTGGYLELNGAPAELTISGQDFEFADFNFMQKDHSLEPGSVYAVKAVYEPGEDLMVESSNYRMISEPYYNKMNYPAAVGGGAYSVDVVFERANVDSENRLRGIARARDLQIRQETTSDLRWENEYLENATIAQQAAKTKTTYSTVPVDNVDEVEVQLVLSGRHNKVDYYLIEAYGASFVTGGGRSLTNRDYTGTAHAIDNYNYNTPDNDTDRVYYRAEYVDTDGDGTVNDDRSGTYGFVLSGTLNNLAQKATEYIHGEISELTFYDYLSIDTFNDMNLRVNGEAVNVMIEEKVYAAWQAAVHEAEEAHNRGDDTWWDAEHDYAQFTYHVIQFYINDFVNDGHAALRDPVAADRETITWCNLHEECAASRSGKPTSFARMVKAALEKTAEEAKAAISLLTMQEAENLSHIRSNNRGTAFGSIGQLADVFVEAVKGINAIRPIDSGALTIDDWDAIQGWILSAPKPANVTELEEAIQLSRDTAWWNDGAPAPGASNLQNLLEATQKTLDTGRDAWINYYRYQEAFADMKSNGVSPQAQWTRITENLVQNTDGEAFDDYAQFRDAIKDAVTNLGTDKTWNEYQYYILKDTRDPAEAYATYWWHNGYSRITDLASLLTAAQRYLEGETAVWDMFTSLDDDLYGDDMTQLHFREGFNGTTDKYTDINKFKADVLAFIQADGAIIATGSSTTTQRNNSWNQLQYYLIHQDDAGGCDLTLRETNLAITAESPYYWWKDGGEGTAYTISAGPGDENIATLMEAVYRYTVNGNPHALDNMTVSAATAFRFVPAYTGEEENWDGLTKYDSTTISELRDRLELLAKAAGEINCKTLNWRQIQHYLLTGNYLLASDPDLPTDNALDKDQDGKKNYWWRRGDVNPNKAEDIKNDLELFLEIIDQYNAGTYEGDFEAAIDLYASSSRLNLYGNTTPGNAKPMETCTSTQKRTFRTKIINIAAKLKEDNRPAADALDWFVLQWYGMNNNRYTAGSPIKDKAEALAYYVNTLLPGSKKENWAPSYVDVPETVIVMMLSVDEIAMLPIAEQIMILTEQAEGLVAAIQEEPSLAEEYMAELQRLIAALEELKILLGQEVPEPEESPVPTESPKPMESAEPTESPKPTESAEPTESPKPTESAEPTESPKPTESAEPTESPKPTESAEPTESPEPAESSKPIEPTESPQPTGPAEPGESPLPSPEPEPPIESGGEGEAENEATPEKPGTDPGVQQDAAETAPAVKGLSATVLTQQLLHKRAGRIPLRSLSTKNLLVDTGGYKMNGIITQKNTAPPGQWMTLRLGLRFSDTERRVWA